MALTVLLVLPVAGAAGVLWCRARGRFEPGRRLALGVSLAMLLAVATIWVSWEYDWPGLQFVERVAWVEAPAAAYDVGIDGSGLVFVTLVTWVLVLALAMSARLGRRAPAGLAATLLVAGAAAIGAVVARDLLLWLACSEVMMCATFVAVGGWGRERRVYAATKFLLCQLLGSAILFVTLIWMAWRHQLATGVWSFALDDLVALQLPIGVQQWIWLAFVIACAVRLPLVPLHTWLTDLLAQASTPAAILIGGAVVPVGAYGLVRIAVPLVPDAAMAFGAWLAVPAAIGVVYSAIAALGQADLRRMTACLLVGYVGVAVAGVSATTPQGLVSAQAQLVAGGLMAGAWLLATAMLAERRQTTHIAEFGGLWRVVPGLSMVVVLVAAAAMALPGTVGFVTASAALEAVAASGTIAFARVLAGVALAGVVVLGAAVLWTAHRVVGGERTSDRNRALRDMTGAEWLTIAPVVVVMIVLGLWPEPLLTFMAPIAAGASTARDVALVLVP